MKKFDFYGQMVLIIIGLVCAIDFNGMGILFAGLAMFAVGIWQLISTIANLAGERSPDKVFFRTNLLIAVGYTALGIVLWAVFKQSFPRDVEYLIRVLMMALPPVLIFRYWIGISKIYNVGYFKKKIENGQP